MMHQVYVLSVINRREIERLRNFWCPRFPEYSRNSWLNKFLGWAFPFRLTGKPD
jgi:hypothetical protein